MKQPQSQQILKSLFNEFSTSSNQSLWLHLQCRCSLSVAIINQLLLQCLFNALSTTIIIYCKCKGQQNFFKVFNKKQKKKFLKIIIIKTKDERKLGLKLECDNLSVTTKMSFNSLKLFSVSKKKNSCNCSHECDRLLPPKQHFI